jgi:hypothetical protein
MIVSKFNTIPSEIQICIIGYLSIQDLIHLYQTSHYWQHKIDNDRLIWRRAYERHFGNEFAQDHWILWAVRRLWSQSSSSSSVEEKHIAARPIHLTMLDHLDGPTWRRLVRGRILTERNWLRNTPQRSIFFPEEHFGITVWDYFLMPKVRLDYGITFASRKHNRICFSIIDDVSNKMMNVHPPNLVLGKTLLTEKITEDLMLDAEASNREFIVAKKTIAILSQDQSLSVKMMLVWDVRELEIRHTDDDQSYCAPRLCMIEWIPDTTLCSLAQQNGWLLARINYPYLDPHTQQMHQQYVLYDIRRGHLAASFSIKEGIQPTLSKATLNSVQIYCSFTSTEATSDTADTSMIYHWYVMQVNASSNTHIPTTHLTPPNLTSTSKRLAAETKYQTIQTLVREQGYWHHEDYRIKTAVASGKMPLSVSMRPSISTHYLINDLFLVVLYFYPHGENIFLAHSIRQQRVLWSRPVLANYLLIPDEAAIFTYHDDGDTQLLDMYTGNILSEFKCQGFGMLCHISGSLCYISYGTQSVLLDVYTGKEIRTLMPNKIAQSFLLPYLQSNPESLALWFLDPTRIGYIDWEKRCLWVDEYAQV